MPSLGVALPWEIWQSPGALAELDAADNVLERSSHCPQGCRYDRANRGPESPAANPDIDRWLYRDGGEAIVFEEQGAGAITRIWMTTGFGLSLPLPSTVRVRFYVDGASSPTLDAPLSALFDGSMPPFTAPLVADRGLSSGGNVSYVPIAYAHGIRIALTDADDTLLWFQFTFHRLPGAAGLSSFSTSGDYPQWRNFLTHQGDDPWNGGLAAQSASNVLVPGGTLDLGLRSGPGWLRGLRLRVSRESYSFLRLQLRFDGELRADLPLADFFATPTTTARAARGALLGEDVDGWLYSWWPMPFRQQATVSLAADPSMPGAIAVESALTWDNAAVGANAALFQAQISDSCPSVAGIDRALFSARGAGRIVGIASVYHSFGAATREYLEGDERAYRDGSRDPIWYGTGVEDFFNGGFYFDQGGYARALSGATQVDVDGSGSTSAYRLLLSDFLSYQSQLDLVEENGPTGQLPLCARSVIYAYARASALLVPYARLEIGDPISVQRYSYQAPPAASCALLSASYADEPASTRSAAVCQFSAGSSYFHFSLPAAAGPLRLRRVFDAAHSRQSAQIWINGQLAGVFPTSAANGWRRWLEQDVVLDMPVSGTLFDVEIRPLFAPLGNVADFTESAYELWGAATDLILRDGFEALP